MAVADFDPIAGAREAADAHTTTGARAAAEHSARMRDAADHLVAADPAFAPVVATAGICQIGAPGQRPWNAFEALVRTVVGQQLSTTVASSINARVAATLGHEVTPAAVLAVDTAGLRGAGLSGAKARTIRGLAAAVAAGDVDLAGMADRADELVEAELTALWGIGRWTVDMFLMFSLHRTDVWPVGDLGVRRGWQQIHHLADAPAPSALAGLGEPLRPYRSIAAWYCWAALDGPAAL